MTPEQRVYREQNELQFGRPDPKAVERGMESLIRLVAPLAQGLVIRSDEHPAYKRALRHLRGYGIQHEETPSTDPRTAHNPLFHVNKADLGLRHDGSNHKRETIAFSKRHQCVIERAAIHVMTVNFSRPFSTNHDARTPAMRLGVAETPRSPEALLEGRLFATRVKPPPVWMEYYRGLVDTPEIKNPRRHTLKLAF